MIAKVSLKFIATIILCNHFRDGVVMAAVVHEGEIEASLTETERLGESKIIGGINAPFESTRHQVSIRLKAIEAAEGFGKGHICGGSLILSKFVVTAGHCVYKYVLLPRPGYQLRDPEEFQVVLGDLFALQKTAKTVVMGVKRIMPHELFCIDQLLNDIAVLKLSEAVNASFPANKTSTDPISVIPIAKEPVLEHGKQCIVTGWGYTNKTALTIPDALQAVDLRLIEFGNCQVSYGSQIGPGMLCAGAASGTKSSCNGDSGGPLVCDGVLHGIVSWGPANCAGSCSPNVYTKVSYYRDWIEEVLGSAAKDLPSSGELRLASLVLIVFTVLAVLSRELL